MWDGKGFQTPVTCLSFYHLRPIEGSELAPHAIDGVQTPPISLASNELRGELEAGVNVGTGTGLCERLERPIRRDCGVISKTGERQLLIFLPTNTKRQTNFIAAP